MISAIPVLALMGSALGALLALAARHFRVESNPLADTIEEHLPGSNCGQCGLPGCRSAAEALANGSAPINLCPPGGRALAEELAATLGVDADLSNMEDPETFIARVHEPLCIGCFKCQKVCPTDAIVGAPKQIHVVMESACTGCGLCLDVCPTECLSLFSPTASLQTWRWPRPDTPRRAA